MNVSFMVLFVTPAPPRDIQRLVRPMIHNCVSQFVFEKHQRAHRDIRSLRGGS